MLKFLGTGSAFNTDLGNNSGYSYLGKDLLLIDCGGLVFHRIQKLKLLDKAEEIYVIITHTHPDHVGSLGDLIFYNYYILNKKINIIFPERELLTSYLRGIGALESMYNLFEKAPETAPFRLVFIKVKHVDTIPAYGFIFKDSEENFYYSGDSNELPEVILNHFVKCEIDKIFQDTCGTDYPGNAHLCIDKLEKLIPKEFRSRVFCMHLDATLDVEKVKGLGFQLAIANCKLQIIKGGCLKMLYPLKFNPLYKDYIWGGRELEKLNKKLPAGIVAESWEVSTHADGEVSVSNGEYKNEKLSSVIKLLGKDLIGDALPKKDLEKFPLLVKLIDANDRLSVQVHPRDEYAKLHENGENGKNEMWYIIEAKPGARIVYGVKPGVTKESFAKAVELDKIEECLNFMEVKAGDSVNIPAGLVHAIGKGIIIAEIQQNSNTTYRVFDYNRTDKEGHKRQLHIEKALQVIDFDNCNTTGKLRGNITNFSEDFTKEVLVTNEYFTVEDLLINGKATEIANGSRFLIYVCISGEGSINYKDGIEKIAMGESVLIPANLGEFNIEGKLQLIKAYV